MRFSMIRCMKSYGNEVGMSSESTIARAGIPFTPYFFAISFACVSFGVRRKSWAVEDAAMSSAPHRSATEYCYSYHSHKNSSNSHIFGRNNGLVLLRVWNFCVRLVLSMKVLTAFA